MVCRYSSKRLDIQLPQTLADTYYLLLQAQAFQVLHHTLSLLNIFLGYLARLTGSKFEGF